MRRVNWGTNWSFLLMVKGYKFKEKLLANM
jgi:hypothetical protein